MTLARTNYQYEKRKRELEKKKKKEEKRKRKLERKDNPVDENETLTGEAVSDESEGE